MMEIPEAGFANHVGYEDSYYSAVPNLNFNDGSYPMYSECQQDGDAQQNLALMGISPQNHLETSTSWTDVLSSECGFSNFDQYCAAEESSSIDLDFLSPSPQSVSKNGKPKRKRVQSKSQRKAANVRERKRMFHLNTAFDDLRKRLPAFNYEKRLSRIETLKLAMTYISFMKDISDGKDPESVKLKAGNTIPCDIFSQTDNASCSEDSLST